MAPEPRRWVALARAVTTPVAGLPAFTLAASAVVVDQAHDRVTGIQLERTPELDELSSAVRDAMRGVYGENAVCDPGDLWQPHIPVPFHDPTTDPPDHAGDVIPLEGPVSGPVTDIIQVDQEFPPRDQPTSWGMVKTGGLIEVDHWVSRSLGERLGRSTWFPRLIGHRQHHHQLGTQLGAAHPRPRNTTDDTGRRGWPPSSTASGRSCWSG